MQIYIRCKHIKVNVEYFVYNAKIKNKERS